ncbi:MAG: dihydropteroate synthase [bacterium]
MIVIGERLNSTRQRVLEALRDRNQAFILAEAAAQREAGAAYIDLNAAALLSGEIDALTWAVPLLRREAGVPLAIDTPNPDAMEAGLRLHGGRAMLNSLTGEETRLKRLVPLVKEFKPAVIALCLDDGGIPTSADQELRVAVRITDLLVKQGVNPEDIFVDPLVRPIAVDHEAARLFLESLRLIKRSMPQVRTVAGISNVSFGLPERKALNRTLLALAIDAGLDAAILDPLDRSTMSSLAAAEALVGRDPSLKNYLAAARRRKRST